MLRVHPHGLAVHAWQLQGLVRLRNTVRARLNLPLLAVHSQNLGPVYHDRVILAVLLLAVVLATLHAHRLVLH